MIVRCVCLFLLISGSLQYRCRPSLGKSSSNWVACGLRQGTKSCIYEDWECDGSYECLDRSDEAFCGIPADGRTIHQFQYQYIGDVFFPDRSDGLQVEAKVVLEQKRNTTKRITIMKLENPKLTQKAVKAGRNLLSNDEQNIWEKPIRFDILDSGAIDNFRTQGDEPADILNIKKSIASLFQMKLKYSIEYENIETDPTGKCRMKYFINRKQTFDRKYGGSKQTKSALHKFNITKTNDYSDCQERPIFTFTNVDPVLCTKDSKLPFLKSRMISTCTLYKHGKSNAPFIYSCHSRERYELKSLAKDQSSTQFFVNAERKLTFKKFAIFAKPEQPKFDRNSSVFFSFDGLNKPSVVPDEQADINEIKEHLDELTKLSKKDTIAYDLMNHQVPKLYLHLVIHLRWRTSPSTFAKIYSMYFKDDYRFWLESALPFFGTTASGAEMHKRIENGDITARGAIKMFSRLGTVGDPEEGLLDHALKLCQSPKLKNESVSTSCWLAFGALVRDYCRGKTTCPQKFIQVIKDKFDQNLHNQKHHMDVIKNNEKLVVALKTIGNAGQIAHLPLSLHILTKWDDHNAIMIAAIESLRRMPLKGNDLSKAQLALLNIFTNKKMCPEIRIVAFGSLMNTGPTTSMIIRLTSTMRTEGNPLVKHYVYTYLNSESKANCAEKKSYKASIDLQGRLANIPHDEFDPRFSFSVSHTISQTGLFQFYRQMINTEAVHTPVSALPRFLKLKNTIKIPGLEFDHMEFKLRQREIVSLVRDMFGPYGSVYDKKTLWDFIRTKRSADDNGFPEVYRRMQETISPKAKYDIPFKLTLSSKLFGAEILYLILNETNPFIQTLIEDGTIKIDKDWWTNSLKAGMHYNISANDILFNSMLIIPTYTGIPLHLRATIAGSFSYNLYGEVTSSPMLNLLSWSNKPKDISGTAKEGYSLSTYSHGRMYWFYRDTRMGYATHHSMSNRYPVPIEKYTFSIQPPSQKLSMKAYMFKTKYTYANSSLSVTRFARIKSKDTYEKSVKVKNVPTNSGFSTFFDSMMGGRGDLGSGGPGGPGPFMGGGPGGPGPFMGGGPFGQGGPPNAPIPGQGSMGGSKPGQGPPDQMSSSGGPNSGSNRPGNPHAAPPPPGPNYPGNSGFMNKPGKPISEEASSNCNMFWKDYVKSCSKTKNDAKSYREASWYAPVKERVDNVEFLYQNITKDGDKEMRFDLQLLVNGDNKKTLAEFRLELNTTGKFPDMVAFQGIPNYMGISLKGSEKKDNKIKSMGCLKASVNMTARQLDFGLGWGKNCSQYDIKNTLIYNGKVSNARLDVYTSWNSLPEFMEAMTCPRKMLLKQMEQMKNRGSNAGSGAQGGMGPGQGGMGPGQGGMGPGQGGMGPGQGGMGHGQGGMGPGQGGMGLGQGGMGPGQGGMGPGQGRRPGQGGRGHGQGGRGHGQGGRGHGQGGRRRGQGGMGGPGQGGMGGPPGGGMGPVQGQRVPDINQIPCWTSFNISLILKKGKQLVLTGFPTPTSEIANFTLPVNATKAIAKAKEILTYGVTATCKASQNSDNIITFDQRSFDYKPCAGCPHVLAKDCSKKELFVVFMKRNSENEKEITLVIKDKKKRGHVFVIKPDLSVVHDGSVLQLKGGAKHQSADVPHVCSVTKSKKNLVIRCHAQVTVIASLKQIQIKVTPWYFRYMCGLCGNMNWMASDDIRSSSNADHLGASWLVPGKKGCGSECKMVHRPEIRIKDETGKLCVTTKPVTRCATNCQPTKTTTVKFGYHCIEKSSDLAKKTQKQQSNEKYQKIIDAFRNKSKDIKENTDVHVDCACNCPKP